MDDEILGEIVGEKELGVLNTPSSKAHEQPVVLPNACNAIRRFNRHTAWLATGVLGSVIFAALVLAVQEHPKAAGHANQDSQTSDATGLSAGSSDRESTTGQATSVNHSSTVTSPQKNPFAWMESPESTQAPVLWLTPANNQPDAQANASPRSPVRREASARVIRPKIRNIGHRSSARFKLADEKRRLIAVWHQSLARSQQPHPSTVSSNQ
jgi:hypothetical protein